MQSDHRQLEIAMRRACAEARKWLGGTSPNPAVGAVALGNDGSILAVAAHQKAGGPHAETLVLDYCRQHNRLEDIATLCVTLEPCNHHGRTPPCTDTIIAAGIKHLVIGVRDPNRTVTGGGIERLRQAGIKVEIGCLADACGQLIAGFAYSMQTHRPWVTVKRALNIQGSMHPAPGQKTFTSDVSLRLAHRLRKKSDAILTGSGTVLTDNPLFTVRHVPDHPGKRRWLAILDRRHRVSQSYIAAAASRGIDAMIYDDVETALADLHSKGAQDVLVEAGPELSGHLLDSNLWTMAVTIQQAETDRVSVDFNHSQPLPFNASAFDWDAFLPSIDWP